MPHSGSTATARRLISAHYPGLNSTATAINPRREIVGYAYNDDFSVERPLFWASPNSAPVELPGLPAGFLSEVYNINPSGQIVGQFYSADLQRAGGVFAEQQCSAHLSSPVEQ